MDQQNPQVEQPRSLTDMSSYNINKFIDKEKNVKLLPLPKPVQKELQDRWFKDFMLKIGTTKASS